MSRDWLLGKLDSYKYADKEQATVEKIKTFILAEDQCFERSLLKGHITGSAWVLNPDSTKVLLTHHKKLNMWMQLGGHSDGDSNTLNVAIKEAQEESGIDDVVPVTNEIFDIDVHLIPERKDEPEHYHYDIRFLLRAETEDFEVSEESHDLGWFTREQLAEMDLDSAVRKMIDKW